MHSFEFPCTQNLNAVCIVDCKKKKKKEFVSERSLLMCLPHLSCLRWSGCEMHDLSHGSLHSSLAPLSSHLIRRALHGSRRCALLSGIFLLGGYASVMLWVIISDAFSVGGYRVLFYHVWLASAGQWKKMASPAP